MSLDLEIRALLQTPQVQEINFNMRGIRATGLGFMALSSHFSDHPIPQRIRVAVAPHWLPRRARAGYDPFNDRIVVRSDTVLSTLLDSSSVIHECLHALNDFRGISTATRSDEGAAYIAQVWYLLSSGASDSIIDGKFSNQPEMRLLTTDIRNRYLSARGIVEITADEINAVRRISRMRYPNRHYTRANGLGGHLYRGD